MRIEALGRLPPVVGEAIPVQQPESSPIPEDIFVPLESVPYKRSVSAATLSVALHELNHCLVARAKNVAIRSVSVRQQGNSLGRTILTGHVNPGDFKIIAAGGSVNTPLGPAEGYGMDMAMIKALDVDGGYLFSPVDRYRSHAQFIIAGLSDRQKLKIAGIIAFLGEVPGSLISGIFQRADLEIELEDSGKTILLEQKTGGKLPTPEVEEKQTKPYTIIEVLPLGHYRITNVDHNRVTITVICPACGAEGGGHFSSCPAAKKFYEEEHSRLRARNIPPFRDEPINPPFSRN